MTYIEPSNEQKWLEELILDSDFRTLESKTSGFNIFEAIGIVRRENSHSDILKFLLDPSENHSMSAEFLRALLFEVTKSHRPAGLSPVDVDLLELENAEVRREWNHIDLLIVSDTSRFVCAIENKIDSSEHSDQLARYKKVINDEYPEHTPLLIFLTPYGDPPVDDNDWFPISYKDVRRLISNLLDEARNRVGEDVCIMIEHYISMLEKHIVADNETTKLARQIYTRHRRALDLIFEAKPDKILDLNQHLQDKIKEGSSLGIELDYCTKTCVRFSVKEWDSIGHQLDCKDKNIKHMIRFEFIINNDSGVILKLIVGKGDGAFRQKVFDSCEVLTNRGSQLGETSAMLFKVKDPFISGENLDSDLVDLEKQIQKKWDNFFYDGEYEKIVKIIKSLETT